MAHGVQIHGQQNPDCGPFAHFALDFDLALVPVILGSGFDLFRIVPCSAERGKILVGGVGVNETGSAKLQHGTVVGVQDCAFGESIEFLITKEKQGSEIFGSSGRRLRGPALASASAEKSSETVQSARPERSPRR